MPGGTRSQLGNEQFAQILYLPSVTYPTLGANVSGTNTFTVPGVLAGDLISWNLQNPPAHIVLDNVWVSASNVISLLWGTDSTGISTGTVAIVIDVTRGENSSLGLAAFPNSVQ
jgi:hypothetical protein